MTTENRGPPPNIKPNPKLSKAERRALQEKQRAEKAARLQGNTLSSNGRDAGSARTTTTIHSIAPKPQQQQNNNSSTKTSSVVTNTTEKYPSSDGDKEKIGSSETIESKTAISFLSTTTSYDKAEHYAISLVSHLPSYQDPSRRFTLGATIRPISSSHTNLHPFVIQTGYLYSTLQIKGGNSRCRAMLHCYLRLIRDFVVPDSSIKQGEDLRHVIENSILKPAFQYWTEHCRMHSVTMGNAYTFLKAATASTLDRDMSWLEMSERLIETIYAYERERIDYADMAIAEIATTKVLFSARGCSLNKKNREEVFLVFGDSEAVRVVLKYAVQSVTSSLSEDKAKSKNTDTVNSAPANKFRVVVVDNCPFYEGCSMLRYLREQLHFTNCSYCMLSSVTYVLKDVTKVLLGASSLLSDGSVFGRVGTAVVALAAKHHHVPVLVCSETYKISNRVLTESLTSNEIGNPADILSPEWQKKENTAPNSSTIDTSKTYLKGLNLLYDLTPAEFVSGIITELGIVPPTSIAVLLREMNLV